MKKIIFACVHNAGRSQMAAHLFRHFANSPELQGISAGTRPANQVHPIVVDAMKEIGIDVSTASPQLLTRELCHDAFLLITMGCGENCPYVPGLSVEDWPLDDPKGKPIEEVRVIRGQIQARVLQLLDRLKSET